VSTVQNVVDTHLKVTDGATAPIEKAAKAAEHLGGALGGIEGIVGHLLPSLGAFGIALSLKGAVDTTEKYLKNIKEVRELTGATAGETDFLFSSARKAGVEYDSMKDTMFQLSRRGAMLEQSLALSNGKTVPGLAKKFERLGVDVSKGPVSSLMQMSDAVKSGKLGVGELMTQFRIPKGQVNDFQKFLKDLDKSKLAAAKKGGAGLVSDDDVDAFDRMEEAQHRIHDAWNRIQVMLGKTLMPVLSKLTEQFAGRMESLIPVAERFGQILADHMGEVLFAAKAIVAVLTAKKVLGVLENLTSPKGLIGKLASGGLGGLGGGGGGIGALVSQVVGIASSFMAAAPYLALIAAAVWVAAKGWEAIKANVDGVKDRLLFTWEKIQVRVEDIGASMMALVEPLMRLFGQDGTFGQMVARLASAGFEQLVGALEDTITLIQVIASFLPEVSQALYTVFSTITGYLREVFIDPVVKYLVLLGTEINAIFDWIITKAKSVLGVNIGGAAGGAGFDASGFARGMANVILPGFDDVSKRISGRFAEVNQNAFLDAKMRMFDRDKAAAEEAAHHKAGDTKPAAPNYDFRGSRFDITQKFAEGFDPDRIAVAFASDLSALGEMRSQSNYLPITSAVR
jgi:hypothetical protein